MDIIQLFAAVGDPAYRKGWLPEAGRFVSS